MSKVKAWLHAARLRTLPLSVSGIIVGTGLAGMYQEYDLYIFILAILATVGFQITSNFANDFGDGIKGTDNENRVGPSRALQSGQLTEKELKMGIRISVLINLFLIIGVVFTAFRMDNPIYIVLFGILGLLSIWAAIKYTVGSGAYGYKGFGDLFVFCFFGLLSVLGSMFLYTKFITADAMLPAITVGLLSTAVLNLNNMRDHDSDKISNKETVVVKMGLGRSKIYHYSLLAGSFVCLALFVVNRYTHMVNAICLFAYLPVLAHIYRVHKVQDPRKLDPELKKLALTTFSLAILFYIGFNYFL